jgi:integrase
MLDCLIYCLTVSSILKDSRNRSPFWYASFMDSRGRRLKRSTKTTDSELAKQIAADWEAAGKAGRAGRLIESQCRKVISEIYEQATGKPLHYLSARSWLNQWIEDKKHERVSERTALKYEQIVREFLANLGPKADEMLSQVVDTDLKSFRNSLTRSGHSASTVNGALKVLRSPFHLAHVKGYVAADPCSGVGLVEDDTDIEKDVFTLDQIGALVATAEALRQEAQAKKHRKKENEFRDWKGAILGGFYTGLRLKDVTDLLWETIDAGLMKIELVPRKTRRKKKNRKVVLPIHPVFAAWLKKQTRGIGKAPVFPSLAGKGGGGKSGLSSMFRRIMERAGIQGRILRERNGEGRSQSSLSFHSLRHSFNSALANAGVDQEIRQKLTGHASAAMNEVYTHRELEPLRAAISALPTVKVRAR